MINVKGTWSSIVLFVNVLIIFIDPIKVDVFCQLIHGHLALWHSLYLTAILVQKFLAHSNLLIVFQRGLSRIRITSWVQHLFWFRWAGAKRMELEVIVIILDNSLVIWTLKVAILKVCRPLVWIRCSWMAFLVKLLFLDKFASQVTL